MIMGLGFSLFCLVIAAIVFFFFIDFNTKASIVSKLQEKGLVEEVVQGPDKSASIVKRVYLSPPLSSSDEASQ